MKLNILLTTILIISSCFYFNLRYKNDTVLRHLNKKYDIKMYAQVFEKIKFNYYRHSQEYKFQTKAVKKLDPRFVDIHQIPNILDKLYSSKVTKFGNLIEFIKRDIEQLPSFRSYQQTSKKALDSLYLKQLYKIALLSSTQLFSRYDGCAIDKYGFIKDIENKNYFGSSVHNGNIRIFINGEELAYSTRNTFTIKKSDSLHIETRYRLMDYDSTVVLDSLLSIKSIKSD